MKLIFVVFSILSLHASHCGALIDVAEVSELQQYEFGGVYRSAVSINAGGVGGLVGVSYEALLSQRWRFEMGIGGMELDTDFNFILGKLKEEELVFI